MTPLLELDRPAYDAGFAAGVAGEPLRCPYPPMSLESLSWHSGYIEGKAEREAGFQTG